ncbi:MAG: hypothetical protein ACR2PI_26385 [Hyphomicrobiaceae bacterium]
MGDLQSHLFRVCADILADISKITAKPGQVLRKERRLVLGQAVNTETGIACRGVASIVQQGILDE